MAKRRHFADRPAKKIEEFVSLAIQTSNLSRYCGKESLDADYADESEENPRRSALIRVQRFLAGCPGFLCSTSPCASAMLRGLSQRDQHERFAEGRLRPPPRRLGHEHD